MPKSSKKEKSSTSTTEQKTTAPAIKPLTKPKIKSFPCAPAFECKSGELLWGQLQHMINGSKETLHDSTHGAVSSGFGGTILQNSFRYRVVARKGNWVVERFESDEGDFGFIVRHEDVSGKELLERCTKVGISHGGGHADKEIVYVNRYDWSCLSANREEVLKEVKSLGTPPKKKRKGSDSDQEDDDEVGELLSGRLIMLDATEYQSYMKLVASGKHPGRGDSVQFKSPTGSMCGVQVSDSDTEYELGWMVYSGEKHKDFPQDDEFIGFVYDSSYSGLEGSFHVSNV